MKKRYTIYLSKPLANRFDAVARVPGTKSALVEKALDRLLDPDRIQKHDEALLRRMDGMVKGFADLQRDVAIVTETVALYVRYFLTVTPPVPTAERDAAHSLGHERFQVFVTQVGQRVANDQRLVSEVLDSIVASNPDLLAEVIDDGPLQPPASGGTVDPFVPAAANGEAQPEETHHA